MDNITLWRKGMYEEFKRIELHGSVLDIGGAKGAVYQALLKGTHTIIVANVDPKYGFDVRCDLEEPLPMENESFDAVLAVNILEHIFNYQNVLRESYRVLRSGGTFVLAVPFLLQLHPTPHDYWRFSGESLELLLQNTGFASIFVRTVGSGVFSATHQLHHGLYRYGLIRKLASWWHGRLDAILGRLGAGAYGPERYPLGYVVTAKKQA
jgi:SAM-dependent methyltransferase